MERHYQLTDAQFETQFADLSMDPTLFSHEAHLRLAWIHIKHHGVDKAIENICRQINIFDATFDDGTKYHTTLTVASIKTVCHFFLKSKSDTFQDFIAEFPRLKNNFKELISSHYGFDVFTSEKAKSEYLKPDLLPYD